MCHISEMRNKGDFRTTRIADKRVIAINIDGENVQAYYNTNDIDFPVHLELLLMMSFNYRRTTTL